MDNLGISENIYHYKPITSLEEFCDKLANIDELIYDKCENLPKYVNDILGRIYIYEKEDDLRKIKLDEYTCAITKKIVNLLI